MDVKSFVVRRDPGRIRHADPLFLVDLWHARRAGPLEARLRGQMVAGLSRCPPNATYCFSPW